jgi:hypothetical protein
MMKREKLFWIVVVVLAVCLGLVWNSLMEMKSDRKTFEQASLRAQDYMEIQNLFAKHSYYYAAQEQWLELETAWSKKRDDIAYGHNNGYYIGRESVENYYGQKNENRRKETLQMVSKLFPEVENVEENEGVGDLVMHTLTTPVIEVAEDRETAQGVWMSIGLASRVGQDGKPQYVEFWEKFGVDFVREDGEWKIWHFQIHSDVMFTIPENMWGGLGPVMQAQTAAPPEGAPMPQAGAAPAGAQPPQAGPGRGEGQPKGPVSDMDVQVEMYKNYSTTTVPVLTPRLPKPYKTWEDTTPYIKQDKE